MIGSCHTYGDLSGLNNGSDISVLRQRMAVNVIFLASRTERVKLPVFKSNSENWRLFPVGSEQQCEQKHFLQVVYLTFERLWHLAREMYASLWPLSKGFILTNLAVKFLQKNRFENIRNRRPLGSSIKHGGFWDILLCRASADDQSPDIPFEIRWILGHSIRPV